MWQKKEIECPRPHLSTTQIFLNNQIKSESRPSLLERGVSPGVVGITIASATACHAKVQGA